MKKKATAVADVPAEPSTENKGTADGIHLNKKAIISTTLVLLAVVVLVGVLTRVVPRGNFERVYNEETGYSEIVEGSYTPTDEKLPVWKIVLSPIMVFVDSDTRSTGMTGVLIIAFIVLLGGTFLLLDRCGVLKYLIALIIKKFGNHKYLLMAVMVFALMALSSTAGVLEESVTLVPMAVAVSLALGWDSLVGVGISLVAVAWGFTAATFNPFNVMTVQKIGEIEIYSGLWLRLITFAVVYAMLMLFLVVYAKRIEKHPEKSVAYESDKALREKYKIEDVDTVFENKRAAKATKAFGICIGCAFVCIILDFALSIGGTLSMGGMAVFFVLGGIIASFITGNNAKQTFGGFLDGIKTIAPAIPLVVIIIAVAYILNKGMIMDTILNAVFGLFENVNAYQGILIVFVFIALLEFFIGSGTAKAFLVMPIIMPLADQLAISRNSVVLSFCMADGFTNLLYPTSGIMIIAIGLIGVSYGKWIKFSWPLFVLEGIAAVAIMMFAIAVGYH